MPIVGFSFDRILVEKKSPIKGKLTIKSDIKISSVEESKLTINKPCLTVTFEFGVQYDPGIGNIDLKGRIFYLDTPERIKNIVKDWKVSKKLPEDVSLEILNAILTKCHIESLILSEKVSLPPQLPLTRTIPKKPAKNETKTSKGPQ